VLPQNLFPLVEMRCKRPKSKSIDPERTGILRGGGGSLKRKQLLYPKERSKGGLGKVLPDRSIDGGETARLMQSSTLRETLAEFAPVPVTSHSVDGASGGEGL